MFIQYKKSGEIVSFQVFPADVCLLDSGPESDGLLIAEIDDDNSEALITASDLEQPVFWVDGQLSDVSIS